MKGHSIGFFGGSFDPLHFGHLNFAIHAFESLSLDQMYFCPSWQNPHKKFKTLASPEDRLQMLDLVLEDIPHFHIYDREVRSLKPAFSADTLQAFALDHPKAELFFLLGDDNVASFPSWHHPEAIIELAKLVVGRRVHEQPAFPLTSISIQRAIDEAFVVDEMMDISGTSLRHRLEQRQYCGHLIPAKVLEYIKVKKLYVEERFYGE